MRRAFVFAAVAAFSLCPGEGRARPGDGVEFYEKCRKAAQGDAEMQVMMEHFVIGVVETGYNLSKVYKRPALACFPEGATLRQIGDVFCKYLDDYPQDRRVRASILALTAFNRAFPCK
jgi:Rap1a immunity proteins